MRKRGHLFSGDAVGRSVVLASATLATAAANVHRHWLPWPKTRLFLTYVRGSFTKSRPCTYSLTRVWRSVLDKLERLP
jgi:hypothetical protein